MKYRVLRIGLDVDDHADMILLAKQFIAAIEAAKDGGEDIRADVRFIQGLGNWTLWRKPEE